MLQGRAKQQAEAMAWCPAEYRAWYRRFINLDFPPDEARRIVEDHIAVVQRRAARQAA